MTRNERLLAAVATIEAGTASTLAVAELASIPERTVRRGMRALGRQGLVWSPVRGRWQLTPAGREIAASLTATGETDKTEAEPPSRAVLATLWNEGLGGLLRSNRD